MIDEHLLYSTVPRRTICKLSVMNFSTFFDLILLE